VELRQLRTFSKVAHIMNFTKAAAELKYAQSSVTAHVKALETELNVALFERLGGQVRLTNAGRQLLPYADRVLDMVDEAGRVVTESEDLAGTLSIGTIECITTYRLPPLLELFYHRFPGVQLSLHTAPCLETAQALVAGALDVGFLMEEKADHDGLVTAPLCAEKLIVVAARDHALTRADSVTVGDLETADILAVETGCVYRDLFELELGRASDRPPPVLELGTIEAIKRTVKSGLGISLLPEITVREELASGELALVPWDVPFHVSTQVAWHREKWMSRELKTFIDEAIRTVGEQ
jgi:DNA-binding transcriptional LysR family regulator